MYSTSELCSLGSIGTTATPAPDCARYASIQVGEFDKINATFSD